MAPNGGTFVDPITLERVPNRYGIVLNKQTYDVRGLREALRHGHHRVPHSRRELSVRELAEVLNRATNARSAGERNTARRVLHSELNRRGGAGLGLRAVIASHPALDADTRARLNRLVNRLSAGNATPPPAGVPRSPPPAPARPARAAPLQRSNARRVFRRLF